LHANVTRNHRYKSVDEMPSNVRSLLRAFNGRERSSDRFVEIAVPHEGVRDPRPVM
jgi:hypothetical protein